jgi:hypothetical protein
VSPIVASWPPPAAGEAAAAPATPELLSSRLLLSPAAPVPLAPRYPSRPGARQATGWKWPAGRIWAPGGYPVLPAGPVLPDNPAPAAPGGTPRARPARPAPRDPRTPGGDARSQRETALCPEDAVLSKSRIGPGSLARRLGIEASCSLWSSRHEDVGGRTGAGP